MDLALIRLYRTTRDPRRLDKLVVRFRPMVRHIAQQYSRSNEPLDDLLQVGLLALLKAIERFDPQPGASFGAYARPTISGEIKRHFRDHTWDLKVPRSAQELHAKVSRARVEHPDAGREELAEILDVTVAQVRDADLTRHAYNANSLDFRTADDEGSTLGDRLGVVEGGYKQIEDMDEVDDALSILGPRDREVVQLRYFDERLQREIGAEHGVSQMQISRILNRSLLQMADHLENPTATTTSSTDDDAALSA
ncbi:sigma-70 family RNA polymerase sigma factor [Patulibacter sp.]|uniref:sigma-70 family RNA polymerase sigma factor n=1 Tax=Patulibacter sp. TaxID=1912859 RepID=UPI00271DD736|nr:sigma-70 family RNA polymerase sigma factor [Patulibacter sp.]MDO9409371.1 sigma-70 family RNA polymerase sigma factor [Patulibacter sp.]